MSLILSNLRTGTKLLLAFGVVVTGFVGLLLLAHSSLEQMQVSQHNLLREQVARELKLLNLRNNLNGARADLLAMSLSSTTAQRDAFEAKVHERNTESAESLRVLAGLGAGDSQSQALLQEFHALLNEFNRTRDSEIIPRLRDGRIDEARALIMGPQVERNDQIRELGQRLSSLSQEQAEAQLLRNEATLVFQRQLLLGVGSALVLITVWFAWALTRNLAGPLGRLTRWADQISRGELPRELGRTERADEVGQLSQAFARMSEYFQALAAKAERLAKGELPEDMQPAAEGDVLGQAFARTGQYFQALAAKAECLARGELGESLSPVSERDVLGRAFATMVGNLRQLVQDLHEGIAVLATASEEILAATAQVASSTQETATAIGEIASTVEEVKQTAVLAGSKSKSVSESTERTRQIAGEGQVAVEDALRGMTQIREQMQAVAENIMRLGEQSQAIGEIVASVNDLAEQSNLLGVNASIEAVKAGEAGKGFSVVAQEVKALAEQSKQATGQVRAILSDIQKAMTKAVLVTEQGSKAVESGYERAQVSGLAIRTLTGSIEESSEVALQIAATSQQQMVGMDQVATAMSNIRQASQDNVAGSRQVDQAARNLHELGLRLKGLAGQFKL